MYNFVCLLPIGISAVFVLPALMYQRAVVESFTHADSHQIGEVLSWMHDNIKVRKMLCDKLFPDLDKNLMVPLDPNLVLDTYRHFQHKHEWHISVKEFIHGMKDLHLHIPSRQLRHLHHLLDSDRSGYVD